MLFTGLGRFVLGETVPSVWVPPSAYGLGRYSRPRAQFLPIRTSQPVNNIHVLGKTCRQNEVNCSWVVILHVPHRKIPGKPPSPPSRTPQNTFQTPFSGSPGATARRDNSIVLLFFCAAHWAWLNSVVPRGYPLVSGDFLTHCSFQNFI